MRTLLLALILTTMTANAADTGYERDPNRERQEQYERNWEQNDRYYQAQQDREIQREQAYQLERINETLRREEAQWPTMGVLK